MIPPREIINHWWLSSKSKRGGEEQGMAHVREDARRMRDSRCLSQDFKRFCNRQPVSQSCSNLGTSSKLVLAFCLVWLPLGRTGRRRACMAVDDGRLLVKHLDYLIGQDAVHQFALPSCLLLLLPSMSRYTLLLYITS